MCDEADEALDMIVDELFEYAQSHKEISKFVDDNPPYVSEYERYRQHNYHDVLNELYILCVMSSPYHITSFMKLFHTRLKPLSLKMLYY